LGILCFVFINITNLSSLLADNIKFKIIRKIGVELTDKVINQFLQLNYLTYTKYKKNFLISRVLLDLDSIIIQVVYSSFELISRIFLVFIVGIFLIWLEPLLTLLSAITLITFYYTIYFFSKKKTIFFW
jgi:ABC-type multidrug transport system fused ATPase/permease subunit